VPGPCFGQSRDCWYGCHGCGCGTGQGGCCGGCGFGFIPGRPLSLGDESADKVTVRLKFRPDEPWEVEPDEVHSLRAQGILIEDDELESDASAPRRKRTPPVTDADTDPDAHPETEPDNGGGEESPSAE